LSLILKTIGAILYRIENNQILYLLLQYPDKAWGFPKGIQDTGETFEQTAKREIWEETGIKKLELDTNHKFEFDYFCFYDGIKHHKFATLFLAKTEDKKVKISHEHLNFEWLNFEDALQKLTYDNNKRILKQAQEIIDKEKLGQ